MIYKVTHKTTYTYSDSVSLCQNIALLKPRETNYQNLKDYKLYIQPTPFVGQEYEDAFGNNLEYFSIEKEHLELSVTSTSIIENDYKILQDIWEKAVTIQWKDVLKNLDAEDYSLKQFSYPTLITEADDAIKTFAINIFDNEPSLLKATILLMNAIFKECKFTSGFTTIATPPAEVFQHKKGVCQDFANLALACMRSLGIPARYVSGYIETIPPKGVKKLVGSDASHAWFSVYVPNYGWFDFDPTNNKIPKEEYIVTGWGRDYFDVVPLKGVMIGAGEHEMTIAVDVERLDFLTEIH